MDKELSKEEQILMLLSHIETMVDLLNQEIKSIDADLQSLADRADRIRKAWNVSQVSK